MMLSAEIRETIKAKSLAYPDGDWKSVNDKFTDLFFWSCGPLYKAGVDPYVGGNEGRANALEKLGL